MDIEKIAGRVATRELTAGYKRINLTDNASGATIRVEAESVDGIGVLLTIDTNSGAGISASLSIEEFDKLVKLLRTV